MFYKFPSSIHYWDSNPRPSDNEYDPITTRPWLPPRMLQLRTVTAKHRGKMLRHSGYFCHLSSTL